MTRATLDVQPLYDAASAFVEACREAGLDQVDSPTPEGAPKASGHMHRTMAVLIAEAATAAHILIRAREAPDAKPGEG